MAGVYFKGDAEYKDGTAYTGGGAETKSGDEASGAVMAWEASSGKLRWEFTLLSRAVGWLLSTAGGLVFGGTEEGNFFALDAETGKPLWQLQLGARVAANPVSFAVDGKQHVAIAAGSTLFVFRLP